MGVIRCSYRVLYPVTLGLSMSKSHRRVSSEGISLVRVISSRYLGVGAGYAPCKYSVLKAMLRCSDTVYTP